MREFATDRERLRARPATSSDSHSTCAPHTEMAEGHRFDVREVERLAQQQLVDLGRGILALLLMRIDAVGLGLYAGPGGRSIIASSLGRAGPVVLHRGEERAWRLWRAPAPASGAARAGPRWWGRSRP